MLDANLATGSLVRTPLPVYVMFKNAITLPKFNIAPEKSASQ